MAKMKKGSQMLPLFHFIRFEYGLLNHKIGSAATSI
jgi:hypothetical protein